jgi:hypothetical protein
MAGVTIVGNARGVFSSAAKTLTFTTPAIARDGDVLVAIVAFNAADSMATPSGWTLLVTAGSPDKFSLFARSLASSDAATFSFPLVSVANEWQAELVVFRGSSPGVIREAGNIVTFTATTSLTTPGAVTLQAISLIMSAWSCSGAPTLTLPAGFTSIDNFSTAVVSSRSLMIGYQVAGATGALSFAAATASVNTTGATITQVMRDRPPITPDALVDLVPGNIGLIGKDTRPAR